MNNKELLTWLGWENDYHAHNPLFNERFNIDAREQIRQLIQSPKPEVTEEEIEQIILDLTEYKFTPTNYSKAVLESWLIKKGIKIVNRK